MTNITEEITSKVAQAKDNPFFPVNISQENSEIRANASKRELSRRLIAVVNERLAKEQLPIIEVFKLIHAVAANGDSAHDDVKTDRSDQELELIKGGEFREYEVQVGSIVPPEHADVEELMQKFSHKLDTLLSQSTAVTIDSLCVWAYLVATAIHPFPDGNGRAGRGLMDYLKTKFQKDRQLPIEHITFPDSATMSNSHAAQIMDQLYYVLGVVSFTVTEPTSLDRYNLLHKQGKEKQYFKEARSAIGQHLDSVGDIADFQSDPRLKKLREFLDFANSGDKLKTIPLVATEAEKEMRKALTPDDTSKIETI
ncbi:MAG: hypothetical protein COY81_04315 [Candidatus Pacebacteria bacterium CG_4_10_14_0_8_um_filter_43_12]|nr:MAG: hypothetical protein COY81_04315 [Candidatus Pacebacteria bacterium CG_4_10_14_0_8_um_filter_43_12]